MAALALVAGLVARVRLVQPASQVPRGRAADVLDEAGLEVGDGRVPDHRAEALHSADLSEATDDGLAHTLSQQELGLGHGGVGAGPRVEGDVEQRGAELLGPLLLPVPDGGPAVLGAGRDVAALGVEPAVAAYAAGDQRLGDSLALQQLLVGPVDLAHHAERYRACGTHVLVAAVTAATAMAPAAGT